MAVFIVAATLMLTLALALVLRPLLRARSASDPAATERRRLHALQEAYAAGVLSDEEFAAKQAELRARPIDAAASGTSKPAFTTAVAIALLLPALAILMYRVVGDPRALDPAALTAAPAAAPESHGADMDRAITGLADKLKQNPDNAEGWALLGRAYLETQRFAEARDALQHAHDLVKDDPDVAVAYAEALTLASDTHRFDDTARGLLESALKTDPKNQRGIWLLGIADYQAGRWDDAIASWKRLLTMLPKGSQIERSVNTQIARAEAARDGKPLPEEAPVADESTAPAAASVAPGAEAAQPSPAADGPHLTIRVTLDPALTTKVAPEDTVFVYAKAAAGPPMPLAIQRLHANQLPATVVLGDGMGMVPSLKLSQFPQVIVGARISKSGNAIAQRGDLQKVSPPLDVATTEPINLTIDQIVP